MSAKDLESVWQHSPELFDLRNVPEEFEDGFISGPVRNPDVFDRHPTPLPINQEAPPDREEFDIATVIEEILDGRHPAPDRETLPQFPGPFQGQPYTQPPPSGAAAPPDAHAFYLPFHVFYRDWWGVYLTVEGWAYLAKWIFDREPGAVSASDATQAAKLFLYYHEAYHHKTECFALRLETTHRVPLYVRGFQALYIQTFGTDKCLEEGLANAHALKQCAAKIKDPVVREALDEYVRLQPPGYRRGVDIRSAWRQTQSEFAEQNQRKALPAISIKKSPAVWHATSHLFTGMTNITRGVNWIMSRKWGLASRIPFVRPCRHRELRSQLKRKIGAVPLKQGGRHEHWVTQDGQYRTVIPRGTTVAVGTQRKILKDLHYQGGLSEFWAG